MKGFLESILGKGADAGDTAELERALQALRLDHQEARQTVAALKRDLERERERAGRQTEEAARAHAASLAEEAAIPISQLLAQAHLSASGTDVAAADVLKAARALIQACLDQGLELIGEAGETAGFDPARHMPLSGEGLSEGRDVVVRFPGLAVGGRVVRKAGVEGAD